MISRNEHARSYLPKAFIALAICWSNYISGYLMLFEESELNPLFKPYNINGINLYSDSYPLKRKLSQKKYGEEFVKYAAKTKKLIPLIY